MVADHGSAGRDEGRGYGPIWGFTIVETLVAILMLALGILALVSAAASLPAVLVQAREDQRIAALAVAEMERLRVRACLGGRSGERVVGVRTVTWSVTEIGAAVLQLEVVVASENGRELRLDTLTSSVAC